MKNIAPVFWACLLVAASATAKNQDIKLSGTVQNLTDKNVYVLNGSRVSIKDAAEPVKIEIDSTNQYSIDIPSDGGYDWLVLGNQRQRLDFMAKAGSKLDLNLNKSLNESNLEFTGKGSEVPNFFIQLNKDKGGIMVLLRQFQQLSELPPTEVNAAIDSFVKAEKNYLKQYPVELPKDFVLFWEKFLDYGRYNTLLNYPVIHEMIRLKTNNIREVPIELYRISNQVPALFNDDYLDLSLYQSYAEAYYAAQLSGQGFINQAPTADRPDLAYQQTDSVLQLLYLEKRAPQTMALVSGRILLEAAKTWPQEVLEPRLSTYYKKFRKTDYPEELAEAIEEVTRFNPGNKAPDFEFTTLEGVSKKLSDLKGSVVYLDFWASWCGPCKREMPHAKVLKEYYKDKDVVFLYVSIDEKEEAWKKGIEAMDIGGMHTRTPGWEGDLAKQYQIKSVPAYFLIDKEGRLVYKQTPRPSQSAVLKEKIDQLLAK